MNIKETKKRGKFRRFGAFVLALSMIFGSWAPAIAVAAPTPTAVEEHVEKPAAKPAETPKEAPAKTEETPAQPEETAPAEKQQAPAKTEEKPVVETQAAPAKEQKNAPAEDGLEIGPEIVQEAVGAPTVDSKLNLKINPPSIGSLMVSGTGVVGNNRRKRMGDITITVTVTDSAGTPQETQTRTIKPTDKVVQGQWSVQLHRELQEGDTITATQSGTETKGGKEFISEETRITVQPLEADQYKDQLKMPSGEIWIEQTNSNQVNEDEQKEAQQMLKDANPDISGKIQAIKFSIDGTEHAYYEVTYTDKSTSGKIEAPNLKIKQVTDYSRGATLDTITVVDNKITGQLAGEGPFDGIKVQIVTKVSDADKETYCKEGKCKVDKDSAKPVDAKVDSATGKFSYTWGGATLPLDQIVGVIVKEKNKFKSCSTSTVKPVTVPPTEVRDPRKLTNEDKGKIIQAIKDAYTVDGVTKLPNTVEGQPYMEIIDFKDGKARILAPDDVEGDWDTSGTKFTPKQNEDGTYKLKDGAEPFTTIPVKDLVKNIAPEESKIELKANIGKILVTPPKHTDPGEDTDLVSYTLTYTDANGNAQTVTATRDLNADQTPWSLTQGSEGETTGVTLNKGTGELLLDVNKVNVGDTLTVVATDNGGIADNDKQPLTSKATHPLATVTVTYQAGTGDDGTEATGNKDKKEVNKGGKFTVPKDATEFTAPTYHKFANKWKDQNDKKYVPGAPIDHLTENLVLEPVWERLKVKVTYKPGDGSGTMDGLTENSETAEAGKSYTLKGNSFKAPNDYKEFDAWSIGGKRVTDESIPLEEADITVTALWKWKKVKVTYAPGEGGSGKMKDLTNNAEETDMSQPYTPRENSFTAPDNKKFDFWKANVYQQVDTEDLRKDPSKAFDIYKDTTLTAQWTFIKVDIVYDPGIHGSGDFGPKTADQNQNYTIEDAQFTPETNYNFIGWKADGDDTKLYKTGEPINAKTGRTLTAQWELMERKITFAPNGGSGEMNPNPVIKLVGDKYKLPTCEFTAPDENQEFDTWEIDGKRVAVGTELTVEKDTVVKALWKPIVWELTVDPGKEGAGQKTTDKIEQGTKYRVPQPNTVQAKEPEKYEFSHWTVNGTETPSGTEITIDKNIDVVAHWKLQKKTVTYENGGGDGKMDPVTRDYGTRFTLPQPTAFTAPANKEFSHWEITGDSEPRQPGYAFDLTKNITVKAVWKDSAFTVTYEPGLVGSGTKAPVTVLKKAPTHKLAAADTFKPYDGFEFAGWEIDGKSYEPGFAYTVTKNTTVTAKWRPKTIQLTFVSGVGSDDADIPKRTTQGGRYYLPNSEFKPNEGYQFRGWLVNGVEKKVGDSVSTDKDVTITALWDKLVKVHYDANGGDWSGLRNKTESVPENKPFQLSYAPKQDGYVFDGWQAQGEKKMYARATHPGTANEITFVAQWRERGTSGGSGTPGVPPVIPGTEPGTPPVTPGTEPGTPPVTPGTEPGTPSMPSDGGIPDRDALLRRLKSLWNSSEMRRLLEESAKKGQNGTAIPRAGVGTAERTASTVLFPVDLLPAKQREDD